MYDVDITANYDSVRYKLLIANVNNVAGKNLVIKSFSITGENIYPQAVSDLIKSIDSCNCNTYNESYLDLINKYDALSYNEKEVFQCILTNDNVTTYYERLQYIIDFCQSSELNAERNEYEIEQEIIISNNGFVIPLLCIAVFVGILLFIVLKKKRKQIKLY